ncbi:MAG TPA: NAD(P)/FAD-dependent oxidoreductase, partial [bacterium]|nr:NAD(P)/FAD-dependent oxidoreductase [bacterium]
PLGKMLAGQTGVPLDRLGRVIVEPDLSVPGFPDILVLGDLAHFAHQHGTPLPGVAPVAMQQGRYAARRIVARLQDRPVKPFHYFDKGSMAVIGRAAAVADFKKFHFSGYPAWLIWLFVHLLYLVEYENRVLVLIQWAWSYFTRNRGARLITGQDIVLLKEARNGNPTGLSPAPGKIAGV